VHALCTQLKGLILALLFPETKKKLYIPNVAYVDFQYLFIHFIIHSFIATAFSRNNKKNCIFLMWSMWIFSIYLFTSFIIHSFIHCNCFFQKQTKKIVYS